MKLRTAVTWAVLFALSGISVVQWVRGGIAQAQATYNPPVHAKVTHIALVGKCDVYRIEDDSSWVYLATPSNGTQVNCSLAR